MMPRDGDPAAVGRLKDMLGDELLAVVDAELPLQGQADGDQVPGQFGGDAIAIPAGLDVGIPPDLTRLPVRRVIAPGRQGVQRRGFPGEAVAHDFVDRAVDALIGFLPEPLLRELVEMGPALEGAVADEEVVLHVPDVPLVLALGLGSGRPAGPRDEAVMPRQIHEARMETDHAPAGMREHGALLVID